MVVVFFIVAFVTAAVARGILPSNSVDHGRVAHLRLPKTLAGLSIEHSPSYSSFSIEPAFWQEFVGTADEPNELFFKLISQITSRGGLPIIRPGGIAMDSMIFDPDGEDVVRTMGADGEVYRTTVGPGYYKSWLNFPEGVSFISTLNFGNNSLEIARDLAVASSSMHGNKIRYFELGNEPNSYAKSRWNSSTEAYVKQWKEWTKEIDEAVATAMNSSSEEGRNTIKWWASSATTDPADLKVRPVDLIPAGIDSEDQVGEFSIHSYVFSTCSPENDAESTIENLLNHTKIVSFSDEEVGPSAKAVQQHGKKWVVGEFNSVACSGKPGVTDTFTQALWTIDTQLTYAVLNATSVNQHQGATLVLQSGDQTNTPGFSAYNFVFPRDSDKYGEARALPGFSGLLFLVEVFSEPGARVLRLDPPKGVESERFSAYAIYRDERVEKLVLLNMHPFYSNSTGGDGTIRINVSDYLPSKKQATRRATVKRLTAPSIDEQDTELITWAGQSFKHGDTKGDLKVEKMDRDGIANIRGSEAILINVNGD